MAFYEKRVTPSVTARGDTTLVKPLHII